MANVRSCLSIIIVIGLSKVLDPSCGVPLDMIFPKDLTGEAGRSPLLRDEI